ncbi:MAG TPA: phytoene desaturase family protein [Ignavibacteria bacterium]|nr:phytoene desaturase family protein [Ignavibacteria bacterium]
MNKKDIIIIGSGLGGLSAALRIASRGHKVKILEKHSAAGGRLNQYKEQGFTFDLGPSFMSMTFEFDELFKDCGLRNPLKLTSLDPLYKVNFRDKTIPYTIWKDTAKLALEFKDIEPDFEKKAEAYLNKAAQFYHDTEDKVIRRNFDSLADYFLKISSVPLKHLPYLRKKLWTLLDETFVSHEVKVIFSLVAFFLGSTPFKTPSIYSLLNYTELKNNGYWTVEGGMYKIVEEIVKELSKLNVEIIYDTEIQSIANSNGSLKAIRDNKGREWKADTFIVNADAASFRGKVLNRNKYTDKKLDDMEWSLAPFTIYLGIKNKVPGLYHHNYFLGNDFIKYADKIFTSSVIPSKPYYYVNMPSHADSTCAPEGCENLFILCPVPDLRFKKDWNDRSEVAEDIISDLSERINFDLKENTVVKKILTPVEWESMFNLYRGSGLGLSHGMKQIGGFRPSNRDEVFSNLFYVGASTVPGTGLPMVLISSKLVTERVLNEH